MSSYLLLGLTSFFWACGWITGRGFVNDIPPMAMTFFRWFFAILIMAPFVQPQLRRTWPVLRRHWRPLVLLGVTGVGTHTALAYLGLRYTTATNGMILNSFIPIMIIIFSWVFVHERLLPMQMVGVAVSFVGVLAILSQGQLVAIEGLRLNVGDLLIVASMAMWSIYTIGLAWRPEGLCMLIFLFVLACVGAVAVLPFWLFEMALGYYVRWIMTNVLALVSLALFSSVLSYVFWNRFLESRCRSARCQRCRAICAPGSSVWCNSRMAIP